MADLIDRAALMEKITYFRREDFLEACVCYDDIKDAPAVDAIDKKSLQIAMKRELARLYIGEEKLTEEMNCYNRSAFEAGYKYALDCVMGDINLLMPKS